MIKTITKKKHHKKNTKKENKKNIFDGLTKKKTPKKRSRSLEAALGTAVRYLSFPNSSFDRSGVRLTIFSLAETDSGQPIPSSIGIEL
jgi:hypothetical protein